jgi:hypothetical protein
MGVGLETGHRCEGQGAYGLLCSDAAGFWVLGFLGVAMLAHAARFGLQLQAAIRV